MKDLLTPKQVATAIGVSESSVKRWCDKGIIHTQYTAGGHRRIDLAGLMQFLRANKYEIHRPEVLGLPSTTGRTERVLNRAVENLTQALVVGDEEQVRRIVLDLYVAEHSVSAICDQAIAPAFERIGELWECGEAEVYQERRGCELARLVLREIRSLIPAPPADALRAIGGAPEGDQYNLATTMAEVVLRDAGWNAASLGDNLPFATLAAAIEQQRPRIFWLSCSHLMSVPEFLRNYHHLYDEFGMNVAFVVGGRALTEPVRQQMKYAAYCDNMQHLEAFAQTLAMSAAEQQQRKRSDQQSEC